jgi:hypothetical protein
VQTFDPVDPTKLDVVRPPRAAEDVEDGQANREEDARQHAKESYAQQGDDR